MISHRKLTQSFVYAFSGLLWALRYNQNLRIHFAIALAVILASIYFRINAFEMGIVGIMILFVISSEMINTVIEEMVNLITNEHRKEAKIAKDVSAAMVLIAAIGSIIVGVFVFMPYILRDLSK